MEPNCGDVIDSTAGVSISRTETWSVKCSNNAALSCIAWKAVWNLKAVSTTHESVENDESDQYDDHNDDDKNDADEKDSVHDINGDEDNDDVHYDIKEDGYNGNPKENLQLVWRLLDSVPLHMQPVRGTKLLVDRMQLANSRHKMRISSWVNQHE